MNNKIHLKFHQHSNSGSWHPISAEHKNPVTQTKHKFALIMSKLRKAEEWELVIIKNELNELLESETEI